MTTFRKALKRLERYLLDAEDRLDTVESLGDRFGEMYRAWACRAVEDMAGRDRGERLWDDVTVGEFVAFWLAELAAPPLLDDVPAVGRAVTSRMRLEAQTAFRRDLESAKPGPAPASWWCLVTVGHSAAEQGEYWQRANARYWQLRGHA